MVARNLRITFVTLLSAVSTLSVLVSADPRVPPARGKDNPSVPSVHLLTGDPDQINAQVFGNPPTAILAVTPVQPPAAATPVNSYPAGCTIVGQELRCDRNDNAGFRAWFNMQLSGWDPGGDGPNAITYQYKLDCSGYFYHECPGPPLFPAVIPCSDDTICRETFGESFAKCSHGLCDAGYVDEDGTGRPDSFCAAPEGCLVSAVAIGTCNFNYFAVSAAPPGTSDGGFVYYGGTMVIDIPPGARGKYMARPNTDETFIARPTPGGPPQDIPTLAEKGFTVNLVTGSCCYSLGTPDAGCQDGLGCITRADCNTLPGPRVFTPGALCGDSPKDCPRIGACCDRRIADSLLRCRDGVPESECLVDDPTQVSWTQETSCGDLGPPCAEHAGACCDMRIADDTLRCRDDVPESGCVIDDPDQVSWHKFTWCADLPEPCLEHTGACCDLRIAEDILRCRNDVPESACEIDDSDQVSWHKFTGCTDLPEPCGGHTGACCDADPFGTCRDDVSASQCNCTYCLFYEDTPCSEIECVRNTIPTVSEWGLVVLTLLLLIAAKIYFGRSGLRCLPS